MHQPSELSLRSVLRTPSPRPAVQLRRACAALASVASLLTAFEAAAADAQPVTSAPPADTLEVSTPSVTSAPSETGFEWGLRLAAEWAVGKADGGSPQGDPFDLRADGSMSEAVAFGVPLIVDLGYRTSPNWWWGVHAQAGLGPYGSECPSGMKCSWSEVRIGAGGQYSFAPSNPVNPWLGVGASYEWLRLWGLGKTTIEVAPETEGAEPTMKEVTFGVREVLSGPLLSASFGVSFRLSEGLNIGPYVTGAAGVYLLSEFTCSDPAQCEQNSAVEDKAVHGWLSAGVRGSYGP
jgi:hypothetical protein